MSVTLKQIAEEVGVSQPLVTYALNGKPGVSDGMRQRIIEAASRLGYSAHDNRAAKSLAARRHGTAVRTGVIALLLSPPSTPDNTVQDNPFFLPYFNGVEIEASHRDSDLFICALRAHGLPRMIRNRDVDGVIAVNVPAAFEELRALGLPVVSLGAQEPQIASLVPDEVDGIRQAVSHLVNLGHRRIAYLGMSTRLDFSPALNRLQSYRDTIAAHGLSADEALIEATISTMNRQAGAQALGRLLARRKKFTALVCYNDLLAMGALDRLQQSGRRVPDDIAVTGFDGYAAQIGLRPALTSTVYDRQEMGRRAVEMLCERSDGDSAASPLELFPIELIHGETT